MDPRPAPVPSDPRPKPTDPFAGLDELVASLDGLPVGDRVAVFSSIHSTLNDALALTAAGGDGAAPVVGTVGPRGFRPGPGGR